MAWYDNKSKVQKKNRRPLIETNGTELAHPVYFF